jgi:four helix bundle protein
VQDHRKLEIWQRAIELAVDVYRLTRNPPLRDDASMVDQMRRAAGSIHSNIAEGAARWTKRDFARFLVGAIGSTGELESHMELAQRVDLIEESVAVPLLARVGSLRRMQVAFLNRVRNGNTNAGER